jgi:hypothetical protein
VLSWSTSVDSRDHHHFTDGEPLTYDDRDFLRELDVLLCSMLNF